MAVKSIFKHIKYFLKGLGLFALMAGLLIAIMLLVAYGFQFPIFKVITGWIFGSFMVALVLFLMYTFGKNISEEDKK